MPGLQARNHHIWLFNLIFLIVNENGHSKETKYPPMGENAKSSFQTVEAVWKSKEKAMRERFSELEGKERKGGL